MSRKFIRHDSYKPGYLHPFDNKEFDYTEFKELPQDRKCTECGNLLRDPVQLPCGHRFCNNCYLSLSKRRCKCPLDKHDICEGQGFEDRAWRDTVMSTGVRCNYRSCPWTGTIRALLEEHVYECAFETVKCPDPNCNVVMPRSHVAAHQGNECKWRTMVCDYCEDKYAICKEEVHKATCRGVPERCLNGCQATTIPRGQMKHHVENDCPLSILPCQYRHVGCHEDILRKDMQEHLEHKIQHHLDLACDKIKDINFDLRDKTAEITQHKIKLDALSAELARNVTGNGALVWAIDNFDIRFRQALNGIEPVLYSEPASSGPCGYKFRALVYLNGDSKAKGSYISVYIQLLKGDHDALLRWPFQQEVKFTLLDQQNDFEERRSVVKVLAASGNNEGVVNFQRPIKSSNTGRGYAKFVPHDVIRTRRYIRDDVMFLKIECEPTGMV